MLRYGFRYFQYLLNILWYDFQFESVTRIVREETHTHAFNIASEKYNRDKLVNSEDREGFLEEGTSKLG